MSLKWLIVPALFLLAACGPDVASGSDDGNRDLKHFKLQMNSRSIEKVLGSSKFKVVFRNDDGNYLALLDYTGTSVTKTVLAEGWNAFHPVFSPDGGKIAFCTAYEGAPFGSRLYVVNLENPEEIDSLDVESAAIPRWYVLPDGDTVITYVDYAGDNIGEKWPSSATWQVSYKGNKFGTPKKIFGRSYNGGFAYDFSFAVTGASHLYFHWAKDDEDTIIDRYNEQQVCNVSVSRDSSNLISFLETAGDLGRELTHDTIGVWHQYLFYEDEAGNILKAIMAPDMQVFDHVEWLPGILVQIGALTTLEVGNLDLALIDYAQSKVYRFIHSDSVSMWHPDLWIAQ